MKKLAIGLAFTIWTLGCGDAPDAPPAPAETIVLPVQQVSEPTSCTDGETRPCRVVYPSSNGITDCWEGVRVCVDGRFGECGPPPKDDTSAK